MKQKFPILLFVSGMCGGIAVTKKIMIKEIEKWKKMSDKHLALMLLYDKWLSTRQAQKHVKSFFEDRNYRKIVIYGMSFVGERLYEELQESEVEIVAVIDKKIENIFVEAIILTPEEDIPEADCMVVTPIFFFNDIKREMSKKIGYPILSMEEVLEEV